MAIEIERLIATLEAKLDKYEKGLLKAVGTTNRQFGAIERRGKQMESRLSALGGNIGGTLKGGLLGFLGGTAALRGAQQLIDASTRIENSLKIVGLSGEELTGVYDRLFASAQKNAAPLEALVELYSRASLVQKDLGASSEELLGFTDNVALALRVSGKSAAEASGALLQLSQALGSGVVRAEEFNSVQEGALPILQAAAAGIKEAGGSVSKLRQLVIDGKVSSEAFFRGFEAGAVILEDKVAGAELTVSQQFIRMQNVLIDAAGKFDEVTGASKTTVEQLDRLAGIINGLSNVFEAAANGPIGTYIGRLSQLNDLIKSVMPGFSALGLLTEENLNGLAGLIGPSDGPSVVRTTPGKGKRVVADPIQSRIDSAFGTGEVKPVSLDDYKPPSSGKGKGGGKSKRANDYEREVEQIRKRTAAILAETSALAGINPLIDDYGFAATKAAAAQELLTAAQEAGIKITPDLERDIDRLATAYATATVEADKLAEAQDMARETADGIRDAGKDMLKGFISDLREGKKGTEALANALERLGEKLLDVALDSAFSTKSSGGGGFLGSIFKGIGKIFGFDKGGYTGDGPASQAAGVVHRGEYVFSKKAVDRAGAANLDTMHRSLKGYAGGGLVTPAMVRQPRMVSGVSSSAAGGHITVDGVFTVENGQLVPLMTGVSGVVAGKQVQQANKAFPGRAQAAQLRGV